MPNSRAATKHACSKSCEISSVITATRNDEDQADELALTVAKALEENHEVVPAISVNFPDAARKSRRVKKDKPTSGANGEKMNWRKRVRVERTIDIEDANRRF